MSLEVTSIRELLLIGDTFLVLNSFMSLISLSDQSERISPDNIENRSKSVVVGVHSYLTLFSQWT